MNKNETISENYLKEFEIKMLEDRCNSTVLGYIADIKEFLAWYREDIKNLKTSDIDKYKGKLIKQLGVRTINKKLIGIKSYINFLNTSEDLNFVILVNIKMIKIQRQEYLEEILSKSDYDRILRKTIEKKDYRAMAICETLYKCGARVSELLQIKVSDVGNDYMSIKGKGSKYRNLFISESLKGSMQLWEKHRVPNDPGNPFLFNNTGSGALTRQRVFDIIKRYAGLARVKKSLAYPHAFRHLFCYTLAEEMPINEVADLAGHAKIDTTRIYTQKTKKQLRGKLNEL